MTKLTLDHVPIAWHDHDAIVAAFERVGLSPTFGGVHDHAGTQMSLLGFEDRSYVELIAPHTELDELGDTWAWTEHIRKDGGPAAWCLRTDDIRAETTRVVEAGYPVDGPHAGSRRRTDGQVLEWDRTELGAPERRLLLPFVIADRTPLAARVPETPSVADGPLTGVGEVVLGVPELAPAVETFRRLYRFPRPVETTVPGIGPVGSVPGQPVSFATPGADWLADRLARFRPGPCACLLATPDLAAARDVLPLDSPLEWPGGRVAFFDDELLGRWLGVIERSAQN